MKPLLAILLFASSTAFATPTFITIQVFTEQAFFFNGLWNFRGGVDLFDHFANPIITFGQANLDFGDGQSQTFNGAGFNGNYSIGFETTHAYQPGSYVALMAFDIQGTYTLSNGDNGSRVPINYHHEKSFAITMVPEPATYAMMLAGLGLIGFVARRRK